MALSRPAWLATRARLQELLAADGDERLRRDEGLRRAALRPLSEVAMHLPARIGDYTDFYASREHATNVGIMFRGRDNALQPNWLHLPVGYHGRASSVVVSGTPFARPRGQLQVNRDNPAEGSTYGPCKLLDYELEMGIFLGGELPPMGRPVTVEEAEEHIFGYVLLNDWSARDIQAWEYVPLGPFTAKSFATTISPWIVTPEALAPFRCATSAGVQDTPQPLPYLRDPDYSSYDLKLEVDMVTPSKGGEGRVVTTIAKSNFSHMYWTSRQMLAHHSVAGCPMSPGDLLGSGTISGTVDDSGGSSVNYGSLLEQTWRGKNEITLSDGAKRKFIQDGDAVVMRGYCQGDGFRVGFGECAGEVLPAGSLDTAPRAPEAPAAFAELKEVALRSYWRSTCSWRVRVALAHHGVPFETRPVHLVKGEQHSAEHLEGSDGAGQVPVLSFVDGGGRRHALTQSLAIIDFLDGVCAAAPGGSAPLVPPADGSTAGQLLRARALQIAEEVADIASNPLAQHEAKLAELEAIEKTKSAEAAMGTKGDTVPDFEVDKDFADQVAAEVEKLGGGQVGLFGNWRAGVDSDQWVEDAGAAGSSADRPAASPQPAKTAAGWEVGSAGRALLGLPATGGAQASLEKVAYDMLIGDAPVPGWSDPQSQQDQLETRVLEALSAEHRRRQWAAVVEEDRRLAALPRVHWLSTYPNNLIPSKLLTGWGMNWWLGGVAAVQDRANSLDWDILVDCLGAGPGGGVRQWAAGLRDPVHLPASWNYHGVAQQLRGAIRTLAAAPRGAKVLIFCRQGECRSACVAAVCLCAMGLMRVEQAVRLVRASRPQALPPGNSRAMEDIAKLEKLWENEGEALRHAAAAGEDDAGPAAPSGGEHHAEGGVVGRNVKSRLPGPTEDDPFDLRRRFCEPYREDFQTALREIKAGRKRSCWSWYIFPTAPWVVNGVERGNPRAGLSPAMAQDGSPTADHDEGGADLPKGYRVRGRDLSKTARA
ncbi:unnamed protein product [Prorocentrum cordatum]|nr:unnamed protein product [Polarella glacialis]